MKKQLLFLSLAVAALLVGCSKESDAPNGGVSAMYISAKATGSESPETKAPLTGISLNGQQAQIYTTILPLEAYTDDKTTMFTNAYAAGTMTFADNRYSQYDEGFNGVALLPTDKSEVFMYGFYPMGWASANAGTYESLSHTFDGKTDLMTTWLSIADQQKIAYQGGASGALPGKADLMFRHLLTRYNVQVKASDVDAQTIWGRIKSINLKNKEIDKVSTGENLGYAYSAGGGVVSFYKLAGTPATPAYSNDLFEQAAFANMPALTTTYQNTCYTMAASVDVDTNPATAELTLVVETLDADGGKAKRVEVPLSFDRTQLPATVIANNTCGYSITVALNFRAGMIEASAIVEAWKDGGEQTEPVKPTSSLAIGDLKDGGIVYEITDKENYKVLSLDRGLNLIWAAQNTYVIGATGQSDTDGKGNTAAMKAYSTNNISNIDITKKTTGDFATDFPAASFCDSKNKDGVTGWYLPAVDELVALGVAYGIAANQAAIDAGINGSGGTSITGRGDEYVSSTENSIDTDYYTFVSFYMGKSILNKIYNRDVRCIKSIAPTPPFAIGDMKDGGIVYEITDKDNYKVFSLDAGFGRWTEGNSSYVIGATGQSDTDGKANFAAMKAYSTDNTSNVDNIKKTTGIFATDFPAASFCDNKNTGGVTGWYLPAKDELVALCNAYKANQAAIEACINGNGGATIDSKAFWSSTETSSATDQAWDVSFINGTVYTGSLEKIYYGNGSDNEVRCVKSKSDAPTPPTPALPKIGDLKDGGIVYEVSGSKAKVLSLDQGYGSWAEQVNSSYVIGAAGQSLTNGKANFAAMKAYSTNNTSNADDTKKTTGDFATDFPAAGFCDSKNIGGVTGWYLPAKDEVEALYNAYTANQAAIDAVITSNSGSEMGVVFWSSTEDSNDTSSAWFFHFYETGSWYDLDKHDFMFGFDIGVRCIKEL